MRTLNVAETNEVAGGTFFNFFSRSCYKPEPPKCRPEPKPEPKYCDPKPRRGC